MADREQLRARSGSFADARKHLVERRNALIRSLGLAHQDEVMEAHIDHIIRIQSVIEVIDKAMDEEARSQ